MILPWLVLLPFIGGVLCWQTERFCIKLPRWIALIIMGFTLVLLLYQWTNHNCPTIQLNNMSSHWQSKFILPWIPRFGINIILAIDGLSFLMIILTNILGILSILCSWYEIKKYQGFFYFNLMCILGSIIGVFLSIDMFLFFFFWEIMLIPIYLLVIIWGYEQSNIKMRIITANKFFIYAQISGLAMLISILSLVLIYYKNTGIWTFNYEDLLKVIMSKKLEYLIMFIFFIAFAIKMPIFPLHGWLSDIHFQSPTAGSVDLSGLLPKTAAYGLLRFSLPIFPNASKDFFSIAMLLGIISIFYGAWLAFIQNDIKRLIAFTSISHAGFLIIAIYSSNNLSYQGAIIQMISQSLSTAGLFILCGQLYERLLTRDMRVMGGLWNKIKWLPAFSIFFAMANLGIPGTGNFIGEFMILLGNYKLMPIITFISTLSLILASVYSLNMLYRIYFSQLKSKFITTESSNKIKISFRELFIVLLLAILIILIGICPQPILNISYSTINNIQK